MAAKSQIDDSKAETENVKSYRQAVIRVFSSYYATLSSGLEGTMKIFAEKAFSAQLITSQLLEFSSIFSQFKADLELCGSHLEIKERCKCLTDIFVDLGGPMKVAGKEIEEKLSYLNST